MEPFMLFLLSITLIGIVAIFVFSHVSLENNVSNTSGIGNQNFDYFMTKVKSNSFRVKR